MIESTILIVSNKNDVTTDFVIKRLHERKIPFMRFNTEVFPNDVECKIFISNEKKKVQISSNRKTIQHDEIRSVWYRRPKLGHFQNQDLDLEDRVFSKRETYSFLGNLWAVLTDTLWVNEPIASNRAEQKALQLLIASSVGFRIPITLFGNSPQSWEALSQAHSGQIVAKPISHGAYGIEEEFGIFASDLSALKFSCDPESLRISPFIAQEKVQKKYDVRLTAFGKRIFAYRIFSKGESSVHFDWRLDNPRDLKYERTVPPNKILESIQLFMDFFKLRYGAFDFSINQQDEWFFLEVNPGGQFVWLELATGDKLVDSLIDLLCLEES